MPEGDIGVIVGRFQVHELHEGHTEMIHAVVQRHQKVVILLGSTPGVLVTRNNPLDFQTRKAMIQEVYPDIVVLPLRDQPTDSGWSAALDALVQDAFPVGRVVLYGSRDSFVPSYLGRWPVVELEATRTISGSAVRQSLSHSVRASRDFRHGVVYAAHNRHPAVYQTVDIALVRKGPACPEVALVSQAVDPEGLMQFPGGFVDPADESLEHAAVRELREETGACPGVNALTYIGSRRQDAWRYRNEIDVVHTTFFEAAANGSSQLTPGDDAVEAEWIPVVVLEDILIPEHQDLGEMLYAYLKKEQL